MSKRRRKGKRREGWGEARGYSVPLLAEA